MLALYRTYRPSTFAEVTGQEHVTNTIQNQIKTGSVSHAYMFTGPRGIGKTTVARLLAKAVNCLNLVESEPCNVCASCVQITEGKAMDVFEIDAASHTDVDHVRENIIKNVAFAPVLLKKKVYIIDEVHMLSTSAFNALLKTLEEPPSHVLFILATTEIHKVPATILSRCQRYDFKRISKEAMVARLTEIVKKESRSVSTEVLVEIARHSSGCERDAESLLGQILTLADGEITMNEASLVLPATTAVLVTEFIAALSNHDAAQAIRLLNADLEQGIDLANFLDDVISTLRDQLLVDIVNPSASDRIAFLNKAIELFLASRRHMRTDEIPQLPAELAIVELCLSIHINASSRQQEGSSSGGKISPVGRNDAVKENSSSPVIPASSRLEAVIVEAPTVTLELVRETETTVPVIELVDAFVLDPIPMEKVSTDETVFDGVPVISVDEIKRKWPEVFEQVSACNASLPLFLQACEMNSIKDNMLELGFEYDLYVQTINKDKNRKLVESILERVLGKAVKIRAVLSKGKQKDETVSALLDAFGGSAI